MKHYKSVDFLSNFRMSFPLHKRSHPIEDLNDDSVGNEKGKELHYARVIVRGPTHS